MNLRDGSINETPNDPLNPKIGENWVKVAGRIGFPGLAMGPLGLTYSQQVADTYTLKYKTVEGKVVTIGLI